MGDLDTLYLLGFGAALVVAAWAYSLTGWAIPVLINRDQGE